MIEVVEEDDLIRLYAYSYTKRVFVAPRPFEHWFSHKNDFNSPEFDRFLENIPASREYVLYDLLKEKMNEI
jgi:hypothetical protein